MNTLQRHATVIIGSGLGDEGKGLLTDFHAAQHGTESIVARFNGGAQAGHTVVLPDGRRHVHSHFASGTLAGAATYLSRYFVSNPLLFMREWRELKAIEIERPRVLMDERGLVTTPYDMLLNQWAEAARGAGKHGSCGIGFGETIERSLHESFTLRVADLADSGLIEGKLNAIRSDWVPVRAAKLGLPSLTLPQKEVLLSDRMRDDYISAARRFYHLNTLARPDVLTTFAGVILEGAQGLLLDEDGGWFPHVTRSYTGLRNASALAAEAGLTTLEVIYVTRAYATRHGAGPLPHELPAKPYAGIVDATNVPNPHQDSLRFGWLEVDLLKATIEADFTRYATHAGLSYTRRLAVTCLDQLDAPARFVAQERLCEAAPQELAAIIARAAGFTHFYESRGPTRATISARTI